MKKTVLYILLLMLLSIETHAQQRRRQDCPPPVEQKGFSPEAFKKEMEDFLTKEADLTEQEGEKFFPMLHEMLEAKRKLTEQGRDLFRKATQDKEMCDCEYEKLINRSLELNVEEAKTEQAYYKKFHTVLSWKKIAKIKVALWKFRTVALKKFAPNRPAGNKKGTR